MGKTIERPIKFTPADFRFIEKTLNESVVEKYELNVTFNNETLTLEKLDDLFENSKKDEVLLYRIEKIIYKIVINKDYKFSSLTITIPFNKKEISPFRNENLLRIEVFNVQDNDLIAAESKIHDYFFNKNNLLYTKLDNYLYKSIIFILFFGSIIFINIIPSLLHNYFPEISSIPLIILCFIIIYYFGKKYQNKIMNWVLVNLITITNTYEIDTKAAKELESKKKELKISLINIIIGGIVGAILSFAINLFFIYYKEETTNIKMNKIQNEIDSIKKEIKKQK